MRSTPDETSSHFSRHYQEARAKFHGACRHHGIEVESHRNPAPGPGGIDLVTDAALIGPADADNLVIVISGTHGLEGLAGSGCQVSWLWQHGPCALPANMAVLFIHLLNPWGAAWVRRQTEDNVDLNRNFQDFTKPLPANIHYEALRSALICADRDGPAYEDAQAAIKAYCREHGDAVLAAAIFQGQYTDPAGVGFGGVQPTWSNRTFRAILERHSRRARRIAVIDIHTGYGPYGYGMLLNTSEANSLALHTARHWYGPSLAAIKANPSKMPYGLSGDLPSWIENFLAPAKVVPVTLEFGTFDVDELLQCQLDGCWLYSHGENMPDLAKDVQHKLQNFYYPATEDWFEALTFRTHQVIGQAVRGLPAIPA